MFFHPKLFKTNLRWLIGDDSTAKWLRQNTLLTCNHLVAYYSHAMDEVFKALADASRRSLLDRLHARTDRP